MMKAGLKPVIGVLIALSVPQAMASDLLQEAERQLAAGNGKAALAALARHESTATDRIQERLLRATALAQSGQSRQAVEAFQALIDEFPDRPEPYNNLAALYASQGKLGEAREVLERALHTDPSYAAVYANLSAIYQELARNSYVKALRIEGDRLGPSLQVLYRLPAEPVVATAAAPVATVAKPEDTALPLVVAEVDASSLRSVVDRAPAHPAGDAPAAPPVKENPPPVVQAEEKLPADPEQPAPIQPAPVVPAKVVAVSQQVTAQVSKAVAAVTPAEAVKDQPFAGAPAKDVTDSGGAQNDVEVTLLAWAEAWARQDPDAYLDYYAADFRPSSGQSREQWAAERRKRLTRAESIQVKLSDFRLKMRGPNRAQLDVIQEYHSPRYQDRTRKRFLFTHKDGRWLIRSEKSLELLR